MPPSPSTRIIDHDGTFFSGVKSDQDPGQIPLGYSWMTVNMINVGGTWSCRPGYRCVATLPDGNLQGGFIFHPETGLEQMLVAIDGKVYVAPWPFVNFAALPNVQLSPYARQIFWIQAVQSVTRVASDGVSPGTGPAPLIKALPAPKAIVFAQDGGLTAPAWYDGSNSGHTAGDPYGTPAGGDMAWVGDRLWVARGHQVFASDISNPFSFREVGYLGGQVSLFFRSDVTAMVVTPSTESPQLMVFTDVNGSIVQANIRDRNQWTTTANFQEEVLGVGCLSSKSCVSHYGRLVWFSPTGIAFYDPALSGKITTRLPIRDNEMLVSKAQLSDDLSQVAAGIYGQWLLMSVPAEDTYNRHTWVLNHASLTTLSDDSGPSWSGYWLGTRPVEWMYGQVANTERIFHISVDFDGKNRLWEAFLPDRLDNKCPITWGVFTRGYFGATASIQEKPPGTRCRLTWVDLAFAAIDEDLNLGVFYAGGTRGAFRQIMNKLVAVSRGSLSHDQELDSSSTIYGFKAQSRTIRTEDANQQNPDDAKGSCGVETPDEDNIDRNFQLLIVGHGPATLKWVRPFAMLVPEDLSGDARACDDEIGFNAVRFDGVGVNTDTYSGAVLDLASKSVADYHAVKTQVVEQDGFESAGVGTAESVVSQAAADRVADIVAIRMAENDLSCVLPPIISIGLVGDDLPTPPVPPAPPTPPEPPSPPGPCLPLRCEPGQVWDPDECKCIEVPPCPAQDCPQGQVWDPVGCQCVVCPVQDCPQGEVWDPVGCQCVVCPVQDCPQGEVWDPATCSCIAAPPPFTNLLRYWTLDETGTSDRVDSVNGDHLPAFLNKVSFDEQPGLFGNALHLDTLNPTDTSGGCGLIGLDTPLVIPDQGLSVAGWFKVVNPVGAEYSFIELNVQDGIDDNFWMEFWIGGVNGFAGSDFAGTYGSTSFATTPGEWTFFHFFFDRVNQTMGYSFNNGPETTISSGLVGGTGISYNLVLMNAGSFPRSEVLWDEVLVSLGGKLDAAKVNYLFNGGAGRTWPIVLP
jgi:hypothetical protein